MFHNLSYNTLFFRCFVQCLCCDIFVFLFCFFVLCFTDLNVKTFYLICHGIFISCAWEMLSWGRRIRGYFTINNKFLEVALPCKDGPSITGFLSNFSEHSLKMLDFLLTDLVEMLMCLNQRTTGANE